MFREKKLVNFQPASRDWSMRKIPTTASVTYTIGAFIYNNESNDNLPVVDATQNNVRGIVQEAKTNGSTTTDIHILEPNSINSTFFGDMESGETITKAEEGDSFDFATGSGSDLGVTISTATTYDVVTLVKFISSSRGIFRLNQTLGVEN